MTEQARTSRVLIGLIVSMTIGAVVLMALDKGAVQGGAFSLYVYLGNDPVEKATVTEPTASRVDWCGIEVHYSQTISGNATLLPLLYELPNDQDLNTHFVICNGSGGNEGQIEPTPRWQMQRPCLPDGNWRGNTGTIRICVIADGVRQMPTEIQKTRTDELVRALCKQYKVGRNMVAWPANWR